VALWLLLAAAALIAWFLVRPLAAGPGQEPARLRAERGRLHDLLAAKEATYAALKEIEFDHLTHKLDEQDYRALRDRYRARAVSLLQEIESLQRRSPGA
jgi:hypothetical protein